MIARYTRPEMAEVWAPEKRFAKMLDVEIAVAQVQARLGLIPRSAARAIQEKGSFSVERIHEIEATTKHDVIAFVSNVAENVGPLGRYVHFGLTSSDVLDTAFSLQIREGGKILQAEIAQLIKSLGSLAKLHTETVCAGRTHGMFAEPTSFGFKVAGFLSELKRNQTRLSIALKQCEIAKLSGAVGTYSSQGPEIEEAVAKKLSLSIEPVATQVIPRDRHAEVLLSLALLGAGLERLAIELRHLQRSEVAEVCEGFAKGQKGSSAMPHKKNPISAENISGGARLLRSYSLAGLENIALWHERDISHSSVERVVFPDAFILCHYMVYRMNELISGLEVDKKQMLANVARSQGKLYSSQLLLGLVDKGLEREHAYAIVQRLSHGLSPKMNLERAAIKDSEVKKYLNPKEIRDIFSGVRGLRHVKKVIKRVL